MQNLTTHEQDLDHLKCIEMKPISNHGIKQPNHQQYIQYPLSNLYTLSETNQLGDYFPFRKAYAQPGSKTTNGPARMVKGALNVV